MSKRANDARIYGIFRSQRERERGSSFAETRTHDKNEQLKNENSKICWHSVARSFSTRSVTVSAGTHSFRSFDSATLCPPLSMRFLRFMFGRPGDRIHTHTKAHIHMYIICMHGICVQHIEYQETLNRLYGNSPIPFHSILYLSLSISRIVCVSAVHTVVMIHACVVLFAFSACTIARTHCYCMAWHSFAWRMNSI